MVNVKIVDYRGHSEQSNLTVQEAETLIGEHQNYHVIDAETKQKITDLSTLLEDQTVLLVPIVAGG